MGLQMEQFCATSTSDDVMRGVDLSGKVALVTGTSAGLGVETASALAAAGATVLMAARDEARNRKAMAAIAERIPAAQLAYLVLDLADPQSIRRCSEAVLSHWPRLDLLINNAGVMACPLQRTRQGWEWQVAVNHIGHFLLTGWLLPALLRASAPRVVNLSSSGHKYSPVDFDDPHFNTRAYDKWLAYGQAKTANIWHAVALYQHLQGTGLSAFAVHPGAIVTELGRHLSKEDIRALHTGTPQQPTLTFKSVPQGAATTLWAATSTALAGRGGLYLEDCRIGRPASAADSTVGGYAPWALDPERAQALWEATQRWTGTQFDY